MIVLFPSRLLLFWKVSNQPGRSAYFIGVSFTYSYEVLGTPKSYSTKYSVWQMCRSLPSNSLLTTI